MRTRLALAAVVMTAALAHGVDPGTVVGVDERLKITAELPKDAATLAAVNGGKYPIRVTLKNVGTEDLVVWPFLSAEVTGPDGKPVAPSRRLGRWGRRPAGSVLETLTFTTLKPGQTRDLSVSLPNYTHDSDMITGWKLPAAGDYKLALRYHYDRTAVKAKYGKGAEGLDDASRLWNKAADMDRRLEVALSVAAMP